MDVREKQIGQMMDEYASSFADFEASKVASFWLFPALICVGATSTCFSSIDAFADNAIALNAFYNEQGVARAEKSVIACDFVLDNCAHVTTLDKLSDANGGLIVSWRHHYTLRLVDEHKWKIVSAIADEEIEAWSRRGTPLI